GRPAWPSVTGYSNGGIACATALWSAVSSRDGCARWRRGWESCCGRQQPTPRKLCGLIAEGSRLPLCCRSPSRLRLLPEPVNGFFICASRSLCPLASCMPCAHRLARSPRQGQCHSVALKPVQPPNHRGMVRRCLSPGHLAARRDPFLVGWLDRAL